MATRIDIIDLTSASADASATKFLGYGYRFGNDASSDALSFFKDALTDIKTHEGGYKSSSAWECPSVKIAHPFVAEVRFRAGVTDNVAKSVAQLLGYADTRQNAGHWSDEVALSSGRIYGVATAADADALYNPLIELVEVLPTTQWVASGFSADIPNVDLVDQPMSITVDLEISDEALTELSKRGIAEDTPEGMRYRGPLGLGLDDLHCLRDKYRELGRQISDIELETFAQSWSEHCKHRFFAASIDDVNEGLFRRYIKSATDQILAKKPGFCLSVFHDNAGGIAFGDYVLAFKVETHNSPSALDPYGGAMTGVLGVNRDCLGFGMGAEPLANVFGYCLPSRDDTREFFRQNDGTNPLPTSHDLADGVIKGIEEGGNHSGIPTVQGFLYEDPSFRGKPLVYCGTLGILPREVNGPEGKQSSVEKRARAGDYIYVFGNHVGFDGIHGATFSSVELDHNSPATAVQIGDPITQKNLQDVLFKAREMGLYRAITDNGAGGLSSSIGEMAEGAGGAEVWLEKVALKYPGLVPWEIWISESQERMLASVPPENAVAFEKLFAHYQVSTQRLGKFRDDGMLRLCYDGHELGTMEMEFLHEGEPARTYSSKGAMVITPARSQEAPKMADVLEMDNFRSRAAIFRRYDHEVQGKSALKPLIGDVENMVSALRPVWDMKEGVALSQAMMPYLTEADPYMAGYASVDLSIRRLIAGGSNPEKIAILDNFCWSKPESKERLLQLRETNRGLYEAAMDHMAPIISGKDSMYNDFRGFDKTGEKIEINALPTLLVSSMGIIDDCAKMASFEFKAESDLIALYMPNANKLTRTQIDQERQDGGAQNATPKTDHSKAYATIAKHIADGDLASVEALGLGGIGFALMRCTMAAGLGADVSIPKGLLCENLGAFAEFDSGFLVSIDPAKRGKLSDDFVIIGEVKSRTVKSNTVKIDDDAMSIEDMRAKYFAGGYGARS